MYRPAPEQIATYRDQGYVVLPGLIDRDRVATLAANVATVLATRNQPESYLAQTAEYLADSPIDALVNDPGLAAVAGDLLGGTARVYLPFTAVKGAGRGAFGFHQDNQYTELDGPACNIWLALANVTPTSGCLRLVPGSHRAGTLPSRAMFEDGSHRSVVDDPVDAVDVSLAPGDAVVFDRLCVHGSGPNRSDLPRVGYAVQFHREDVRWNGAGTWRLLADHPRWQTGPVAALSDQAGQGE
ncbi:MAG: phytanoyl-CoA dioxygenase family protein [Planctomycetota bacterium]